MTPPLIICDVESTGLDPMDDIWDLAAVRRAPGRDAVEEIHCFVEHDVEKAKALPAKFRADHDRRFDPAAAWSTKQAADAFHELTRPGVDGEKAHLVGAVPSFDAGMLAVLLDRHGLTPRWSHRLICVESLAAGHLGRYVGGLAACAEALGIGIDAGAVHTARGDMLAAVAIWDHVMTGGGS